MPKLDFRHLSSFEAIAECPTLAEAARSLSITPSALTHRIREAERRLAVPLVAHAGNRVRLTDAGARIVIAARRCIAELDAAERDAGAVGGTVEQIVRLGGSTLCSYDWLPALLRHLQAYLPLVDAEVVMDVSLNPLAALRERRIDIAVLPSPVRGPEWRSLRLYRDEMVAVLPAEHALARRRFVEVKDVANEVYVADSTTPERGREYERLFEPAGLRPARVLRAGHLEAVVGLVRAALGVTVATRGSIAPYLPGGGLAVVPLTARGTWVSWYAVLRKSPNRESPARVVAEALALLVQGR